MTEVKTCAHPNCNCKVESGVWGATERKTDIRMAKRALRSEGELGTSDSNRKKFER